MADINTTSGGLARLAYGKSGTIDGRHAKKMLAKHGAIAASSILSNIYLSCEVTEQKL